MARNGAGVYSLPSGSIVADGQSGVASQHNTPLNDLAADANVARPIVAGGTGAATAADARTNLGVGTASDVVFASVEAQAAEPRIFLDETDGTTGWRALSLGLSGGDFLIQTRDSNNVLVSNDYEMTRNSSGAVTHVWSVGGNETLSLSSATLRPSADGVLDLGSVSFRWDDIYAVNGTINTSDGREKQDMADLDDAERRVAMRIMRAMGKFRWRRSVSEKGEAARTHVGVEAQKVIRAFQAERLDPWRYGIVVREGGPENEQGRLGLRYNELFCFVLSALFAGAR